MILCMQLSKMAGLYKCPNCGTVKRMTNSAAGRVKTCSKAYASVFRVNGIHAPIKSALCNKPAFIDRTLNKQELHAVYGIGE